MWPAPRTRYRIALALGDLDLRDALAEMLAGHPALGPAAAGEAPDLTISDRREAAPAAVLSLGAEGAVPADAPPELILSAAHVVAAGYGIAAGSAPRAGPVPVLSPREREVLALMLEGAPNKVIARALGISVSTAKFHVAAVLAKLGAHNRSEAVARALREGLIAF